MARSIQSSASESEHHMNYNQQNNVRISVYNSPRYVVEGMQSSEPPCKPDSLPVHTHTCRTSAAPVETNSTGTEDTATVNKYHETTLELGIHYTPYGAFMA